MTDKKISELTNILGSQVDDANDELAIVDSSAGTTNAITRAELLSSVSAMSITGDLTVSGSTSLDSLSVDTDTLYVDSANNRVGIGTSSPDEALTIQEGAVKTRINLGTTEDHHVFATNNGLRCGGIGLFTSSADLYIEDDTGDSITFDRSANTLKFETNNSEAMRIDSSGNVGIGTSSPGTPLQVSGRIRSIAASGSNGFQIGDFGADAGTFKVEAVSGRSLTFVDDYAGSERMRIDSSGNLLVGRTTGWDLTSADTEGFGATPNAMFVSRNANPSGYFKRYGSTGRTVDFYYSTSRVGDISVTASATSYNTSSDERLKENIADAKPASDLIDGIQVREFDWKADGEHQRYGMIAQELETVAPEAVTKGETEDDMWSVDYSKLVPMLVKEIQDLRKRVNELENTQ